MDDPVHVLVIHTRKHNKLTYVSDPGSRWAGNQKFFDKLHLEEILEKE
jgi:hypothetical protein